MVFVCVLLQGSWAYLPDYGRMKWRRQSNLANLANLANITGLGEITIFAVQL
jgi:hypothetical protein